MNPSTTLMMFIHPPDLGACFSHEGKSAKSVKGSASAMANPSMPMAGASQLPLVVVSTSSSPMMGAVHENDTSTSVKAIRKMDSWELRDESLELAFAFDDSSSLFWSTFVAHESGSLISNHTKNDRANTTSNRNRKMLKKAFVDMAFSVSDPKMAVTSRPNAR